MTWTVFAADVPRFVLPNGGLLIEGQRTNGIRNPRCEGAVAGTPGTNPTNWATFGFHGISFNVVGSGAEAGIPYVDLRLSGTATQNTVRLVRADEIYPTAAQNEVWTHSVFMRLVGGTLNGITNVLVYVTEWTTAGVFVTQGFDNHTVAAGPLGSGRIAHTRTLTDATTGRAGSQIGFEITNAAVVDATLRIGAPQLELGDFASTPIFPPVSAPATSTRGADLVSATLSSLGIGGNGACTVLTRGMIPQDAGASRQILVHMDDGTLSNRFVLSNEPLSATIAVWRDLAGTPVFGSIGTMTAGTPFRAGFTIDGTGRIAGSFNGGAVVAVTGGPTSGLTHLRLGGNIAGVGALFGTIERLQVIPRVVSDAELAALVAAF